MGLSPVWELRPARRWVHPTPHLYLHVPPTARSLLPRLLVGLLLMWSSRPWCATTLLASLAPSAPATPRLQDATLVARLLAAENQVAAEKAARLAVEAQLVVLRGDNAGMVDEAGKLWQVCGGSSDVDGIWGVCPGSDRPGRRAGYCQTQNQGTGGALWCTPLPGCLTPSTQMSTGGLPELRTGKKGCVFTLQPFHLFYCWQLMAEGRVRECNVEKVAYRLLSRLLDAYPPCQMFKVALQMACPAARGLSFDALQGIAHTTAGRLMMAMDLICKVLGCWRQFP